MFRLQSTTRLLPIIAVVLFLLPTFSIARGQFGQVCKKGKLTRKIEVNYAQENKPVPCQVHYYKNQESPGRVQVLWTALTQSGYCEKKVDEMAKTLVDSGWDCSRKN